MIYSRDTPFWSETLKFVNMTSVIYSNLSHCKAYGQNLPSPSHSAWRPHCTHLWLLCVGPAKTWAQFTGRNGTVFVCLKFSFVFGTLQSHCIIIAITNIIIIIITINVYCYFFTCLGYSFVSDTLQPHFTICF